MHRVAQGAGCAAPDMQPEIRAIRQSDAQAFGRLLIQLSRETPYTLLSETENAALADTQPERTRQLIAAPGQQVLVAVDAKALIGFTALSQGAFERNRHVCSLMTGVLRAHWRQGVGTALMEHALDWVAGRGITRVELTVMERNTGAIRFYENFGFAREGIKRRALLVDGDPADELCMALLSG
jgi:RimJ/RimL family protein N-acetyltransferase